MTMQKTGETEPVLVYMQKCMAMYSTAKKNEIVQIQRRKKLLFILKCVSFNENIL